MSLLPPPRTNQRRLYAARGGVGEGSLRRRRKIPGINRRSESKEEGGNTSPAPAAAAAAAALIGYFMGKWVLGEEKKKEGGE